MHWYLNGKRHEFLKKDGTPYARIPKKMVDESGAVAGATEILKAFAKSFWMKDYFGDLAVKAAFDVAAENALQTVRDFYTFEDFYDKAITRFREMADRPAGRGALIHWAVEQHFSGLEYPTQDAELAVVFKNAVAAVQAQVGILCPTGCTVRSEVTFNTDKYGGTIDIEVYDSNHTRVGVLDVKSIDGDRPPRITECAQLAAYEAGHVVDHGDNCFTLVEDNPMLTVANIYVNSNTGEHVKNRIWTKEERMVGMRLMEASLIAFNIWREYGDMENG